MKKIIFASLLFGATTLMSVTKANALIFNCSATYISAVKGCITMHIEVTMTDDKGQVSHVASGNVSVGNCGKAIPTGPTNTTCPPVVFKEDLLITDKGEESCLVDYLKIPDVYAKYLAQRNAIVESH